MRIDSYIEEFNKLPRRVSDFLNRVIQAINGGIEFGSPTTGTVNINGVWAAGTTPVVADQEFNFTHNMGRVPTGFLQVSVDQSAVVYKGATAWTVKQIFLKCHQTSVNYKIFIF